MKQLLQAAAALLMLAAFFDLLITTGLGHPAPWLRDLFLAASGAGCIYLLFTYRKKLK